VCLLKFRAFLKRECLSFTMKNSLVLFLIVALFLTGFARVAAKPVEKIASPGKKSEISKAQAYAHYLMGLIYDRQGDFEKAAKEYRQALRFAPNSSALISQLANDYAWMGHMYQRQGKQEKAIQNYKSFLKLRYDDPDKNIAFRFSLAAVYEKAGKLKEAGNTFEEIIKLNPKVIEAYLQLGRLYLKRNLPGKGIKILKEGRKLFLRKSDLYLLPRAGAGDYREEIQRGIYFLLGISYSEEGNYDKAISGYREYLKLDPDNDVVHFYLGANLDRQGKRKEAIVELKKAVELNPDNAEALNYLGYLYVEKGIKLDKAIKLIRQALEVKPDSSYIVDSLGWALFKKGKFDEALKELKRAVKLSVARDEDDAVIRSHLGDAYFSKGMVKEALRQWKKSLELNPKNDQVREKIKKYKTRQDSQDSTGLIR